MDKNKWKEDALCKGFDTNLFFDKYEEDELLRPAIEELCADCPVARMCFAVGISTKATGVWGGIYLDDGNISKEFNKHRTKANWAETWNNLTNEVK